MLNYNLVLGFIAGRALSLTFASFLLGKTKNIKNTGGGIAGKFVGGFWK